MPKLTQSEATEIYHARMALACTFIVRNPSSEAADRAVAMRDVLVTRFYHRVTR